MFVSDLTRKLQGQIFFVETAAKSEHFHTHDVDNYTHWICLRRDISVWIIHWFEKHLLINRIMHLTPKEIDKLQLLTLGMIAERRLAKGLKLNYPETVAYITSSALEGAREGKSVEEVMHDAANLLTKDKVMEGVADMIQLLQVEAVFTDGSRLVSIHHPIK